MEHQERILLVEDDAVIQHLIMAMLEGAGYSVVCAQDGEAGWEALNASTFDLVITDNNMPKLSGVGMVRRLRAALFNIPVILISGDRPGNVGDFETLLTPGEFLEKPFSMAKLLGCIRSHSVVAGSSHV